MLADDLSTLSQIGVWVVVFFLVVRGLADLKNVIDWIRGSRSESEPKDSTQIEMHNTYKRRFVTREELNGSLLRLEQSQVKIEDKLDRISEDVAVLKSKQTY